jgi:hypothetical protein
MIRNAVFFILILFSCSLFGQKDSTASLGKEFSNRFLLKEININTGRSEFSPFLINNNLYFVSDRKITFAVIFTGDDFTDVYSSTKNDSTSFAKAQLFKLVNSVTNDGPVSFDKPGTSLYFSTNEKSYDYLVKENKTEKKLKIYYSDFVNGKWETPKLHPVCTQDFSYCHPAISPDNKTLYFSSDLPGGYGGMDIYRSTNKNGIWSAPENLGVAINSASDEIFPFINASSVLFFSSKRSTGLGGLDIYFIDLKDSSATHARLADRSINSNADDFGIWTDSTFDKGYVSSNRNIKDNDGIFYFQKTVPDFFNCLTMKHNLCYSFFEEATLEAEDTLGMTYEWTFGDGTKQRGIKVKHCFPNSGSYLVELNIIEKSSGHLFYNELSYDFTTVDPDQLLINCPDTVPVNTPFLLDASKSKMDGYSIVNYYWIFSDTAFNTGQKVMHQYNANGNYIAKLGVIVQNDSTKMLEAFCTEKTVFVGDSSWLAEHGVKIILDYDTVPVRDSLYYAKQGEDVSFKVNLGTSEKQIPTNASIFDGIEKVEEHKEKGYYRYTSGDEQKIANIISYYQNAKAKGFNDAVVVSYYKDSLIAGQENSLKGSADLSDTSKGNYSVVIYYKNPNAADSINENLRKQDSLNHIAGLNKNPGNNKNPDLNKNPDPDKNPITASTNSEYSTSPVDMAWFMYKSLNDTNVYHTFLTRAGNHYDAEIIYRVQIGAYRHPENFRYPQMMVYGNANVNPLPDGITRFTYKTFKTIGEAEVFRQECMHKGIADAWITAEYKGERLTLEELIARKLFEKIPQ